MCDFLDERALDGFPADGNWDFSEDVVPMQQGALPAFVGATAQRARLESQALLQACEEAGAVVRIHLLGERAFEEVFNAVNSLLAGLPADLFNDTFYQWTGLATADVPGDGNCFFHAVRSTVELQGGFLTGQAAIDAAQFRAATLAKVDELYAKAERMPAPTAELQRDKTVRLNQLEAISKNVRVTRGRDMYVLPETVHISKLLVQTRSQRRVPYLVFEAGQVSGIGQRLEVVCSDLPDVPTGAMEVVFPAAQCCMAMMDSAHFQVCVPTKDINVFVASAEELRASRRALAQLGLAGFQNHTVE